MNLMNDKFLIAFEIGEDMEEDLTKLIANVTVVSPNCETFAFDNGPANVLIDYFVNKYFGKELSWSWLQI